MIPGSNSVAGVVLWTHDAGALAPPPSTPGAAAPREQSVRRLHVTRAHLLCSRGAVHTSVHTSRRLHVFGADFDVAAAGYETVAVGVVGQASTYPSDSGCTPNSGPLPSCGFVRQAGGALRFRCHVPHAAGRPRDRLSASCCPSSDANLQGSNSLTFPSLQANATPRRAAERQ